MRQIVYFSTAAGVRQDTVTLAAVLAVSLDRNRRDGICGLLLAGGHRYLQILEGAPGLVEATMTRIHRDDRHLGVTILVDRTVRDGCFNRWSMVFYKEPRLGEFATLGDMVEHLRGQVPDGTLRKQIDCFARSFIVPSNAPLASPWTTARHYDPTLLLDRSH